MKRIEIPHRLHRAAIALAVFTIGWTAPSHATAESPNRSRGWCEFRQLPGERFPPPRLNLPAWACAVAYEANLHARYAIYSSFNPFFLSADFNGDGKFDVAVWVMEKRTRKLGLVIFHRGRTQPFILGAGKAWEDRGDDWRGIDQWTLIPKEEGLDPSDDGSGKVQLRGDAMLLGKVEAASFALYWDGKKYASLQFGD